LALMLIPRIGGIKKACITYRSAPWLISLSS
jgi:hypothetical protein